MSKVVEKVLIVSDLQYPYIDMPVWNTVLRMAKDYKPTQIILNGDIHDFYGLSDFKKDPTRASILQDEVDGLQAHILAPLAKLGVPLTWNEGNHEERLKRYLWSKAPELASLRSLKLPRLFELDEYGCRYEEEGVQLGRHLYVTHGHLWSMHSAYTAKRHWERYGSSMVIGHSHRVGVFCVRDMRGVHEVVEAGCLCSLKPDWIKYPNWQQGFACVTIFANGSFNTTPVKIINREVFMFGDKVYDV